MPEPKMSEYSYRSVKIEALDDQRSVISEATGFLYTRKGKYYVVTNWHVVSGKNPIDETFLQGCSGQRRPQWLRLIWPQVQAAGSPMKEVVPLYDEKEKTSDGLPRPRFLTPDGWMTSIMPHSDVAVLPLEESEYSFERMHFYDGDGVLDVELSVTDTVFVIGYPKDAGRTSGKPPVWTRGSIASEPNVDGGRSELLIDARTRPGQSGSPVIQYRRAFEHFAEGGLREHYKELAVLVGVYSGRTDKDSDLGRIWPVHMIVDSTENMQWWDW